MHSLAWNKVHTAKRPGDNLGRERTKNLPNRINCFWWLNYTCSSRCPALQLKKHKFSNILKIYQLINILVSFWFDQLSKYQYIHRSMKIVAGPPMEVRETCQRDEDCRWTFSSLSWSLFIIMIIIETSIIVSIVIVIIVLYHNDCRNIYHYCQVK